MKKTLMITCLLILGLFIVGCANVDNDTAQKFNQLLIKEKIISNQYSEYNVYNHHYQSFSGGPGTRKYYYIYKSDNDLIQVSYDIKYIYDDNHKVKSKYYVANIEKVIEQTVDEYSCRDESDNYDYDNGFCSTVSKYQVINESDTKTYKIVEKKFLIFKSYQVEK